VSGTRWAALVLVVLGVGVELAGVLVAVQERRSRAAALRAYRKARNVVYARAGLAVAVGTAANARVETGPRTLEERLGDVEARLEQLPAQMEDIAKDAEQRAKEQAPDLSSAVNRCSGARRGANVQVSGRAGW
jgi:hypothetical protein